MYVMYSSLKQRSLSSRSPLFSFSFCFALLDSLAMAATMASSQNTNHRKLHAIAIPYPAQGHINPLLQLCQLLVPHGFSFTFVVSSHIHHRLHDANPLSSAFAGIDSSSPPPIRVVSVDGGFPPEVHAFRDTKVDPFLVVQEMMAPVEELLASMHRSSDEPGSSSRVDFILADVLLGWSHGSTAPKFGLPSVAFWCASATTCSIVLHFADLITADATAAKASAAIAAEEGGVYEGIPGLPPMEAHYVPRIWDDEGKPREPVIKLLRNMSNARLLLLNTFREIEASCIDALSHKIETMAVGPLLSAEISPAAAAENKEGRIPPASLNRLNLFQEDETCLLWLDRQAPASVLFVSFGSISVRKAAQMAELRAALDMGNGAPSYLWVCRPEVDGVKDYLRDSDDVSSSNGNNGSSSRMKFSPSSASVAAAAAAAEKGMVVGWAPQVAVLSHPAVGGFLTHCGWNSVLESVACGVPLLCWADTYERMSNQQLVVDVWGCGADLAPDRRAAVAQYHAKDGGGSRSVVGAQHLRSVIADFMGGGELGNRVRRRAAELKAVSADAFRRSSVRLAEFAHSWKRQY